MEIISAENPRRTKNGILLDVIFEEIGAVQFHAIPFDIEPHGRELYERAESGEFGPVAPYSDPEIDQQAIARAVIIGQINTIEATVTQRRMREATLGIDNGWLAEIDAKIAMLRAQLWA